MDFPLAELADLADTVGGLVSGPLSGDAQLGLSDAELVGAVRSAEQLGRWADAVRLTLAGEVGRRADAQFGEDRITRRFGGGDAADLLERAALVSPATARGRLRDAKAVTTRVTLTGAVRCAPLAHARVELVAGRLSGDALATIADALRPIQGRCSTSDLAAAERELVGAAVGGGEDAPCSIRELRIMGTTWALYLDPDGCLPDEDYAQRARGIRLGRSRRGLRHIRGDVTEDVGAQLERLFDAHLNPRVEDRTPRFTDAAETDDQEIIRDPRSADQRRHDAFAAILAAAAGSVDTPTLGGAAPTLIVTVSEEQLHRPDGVAFLDGPDGHTPVPASLARHVGCHGTIHRVTLAPGGAIRSLTVTDRCFTHWQRKTIAVRDGGCIIPGCGVRASWCEVHHVVDAARGGPTHVSNGVLLCWHHHRTLETSGWQIRIVDGAPQVRPPAWIDPQRRWRPPNPVLHREHQRARPG